MAAFFSSIALVIGLQPGEISLLKLLFYPLAFRCLCHKVLEIGLVKERKHGDILVYMIVAFFCGYTYSIEMGSCPKNFYKIIDGYAKLDAYEKSGWGVASSRVKAENAVKYKLL